MLLSVNACSSSDEGETSSTPQTLTTTLPAQKIVGLPEGYPQKLVPMMENTNLRSSTFDKNQGSASLVFDSTTESEKIFSFYSDHFLALGFTKVPETATLNEALREFQRHDAEETASVAITKGNDGEQVATVSVNGVRLEDFK